MPNKSVSTYGSRCSLCNGEFKPLALQIDHRVPYEIGGDYVASEAGIDGYMLVCGPCNRRKSWTCEHCPNWISGDAETCESCYWTSPTNYEHVATVPERRADVVWAGDETKDYESIKASAAKESISVAQYIKNVLKKVVTRANRLFFS